MTTLKIAEGYTVQFPMVKHVAEVGWTVMTPEEAEASRHGRANMLFRDDLEQKLVEFNAWAQRRPGTLHRRRSSANVTTPSGLARKALVPVPARLPRPLLGGPASMLSGDGAALLTALLTTDLTSSSMVVRIVARTTGSAASGATAATYPLVLSTVLRIHAAVIAAGSART